MPKSLKLVASNTIEDTYANLNAMQTPPPKHVKCIATNNGIVKIGDGVKKFNELPSEVDGWKNISLNYSGRISQIESPTLITQNKNLGARIEIINPSVYLTVGTPIMLATGTEDSETRYYFIVSSVGRSGGNIPVFYCVGENMPSISYEDLQKMRIRVGSPELLVQFDIILPNELTADTAVTDFADGLVKNNAKTSFCYRLGKAHIIEVQAHLEKAAATTQPKFNVLIGKDSTTKVFNDFEVQETIDASDEPTYIYPNALNTNVINQDDEIEVIMPTLGTGDAAAGLTLSFLAVVER